MLEYFQESLQHRSFEIHTTERINLHATAFIALEQFARKPFDIDRGSF